MNLTKLTKPRARYVTFKVKTRSAISRLVHDKLTECVVSVKDFGAKGDFKTDDTDAFEAMIEYLNTLKNGSSALQNQIAGVKVLIPYGVYTITRPIKFNLLLHFKIEGNMAEIYYKGAPLDTGTYAITFSSLSWCFIEGLYFYCTTHFKSCYRLNMKCLKFQADTKHEDLWNLKAESCWSYWGNTEIVGGHQQLYSACSFEFGNGIVKIRNPDGLVFSDCYTEDKYETFWLYLDDIYPTAKSVTWRNCWIDVQRQGQVHYQEGRNCIKFNDDRSVKKEIPAVFLFTGCTWQCAGLQVPSNATGAYIKAHDAFVDIRVEGSTYTVGKQSVGTSLLVRGDSMSANNSQVNPMSRLFLGKGIYVDDIVLHNNPLKNGEFYYFSKTKEEMDRDDLARTKNLGWWFENSNVSAKGYGAVTLGQGGIMKIRIPVIASNHSGFADDKLCHGATYYMRIGYQYGSGTVDVRAVTSNIVGASLIDSIYDGNMPEDKYNSTKKYLAFTVPSTANYVEITISAVTSYMRIFNAALRIQGQHPNTWLPRLDAYPEVTKEV